MKFIIIAVNLLYSEMYYFFLCSYDSRGKVNSPQRESKNIVLLNSHENKPGLSKSGGGRTRHRLQQGQQQQWGDEEVWGLREDVENENEVESETATIDKSSGRDYSSAINPFPGQTKKPRTRAWFDVSNSEPAHLLIRDVSGRDEGSYRCKVHFRHSPSWSQRITLSVKGE